MKPRIITTAISDKRMLTISEAAQYVGLGNRTARVWLEQIGALKRVGSRTLFDKTVIDRELDKKDPAS